MDAITEIRLLKNIHTRRVTSGICFDVTHCKIGLQTYIDCKHLVSVVVQLPFFKEQVIPWTEKAKNFKTNVLLYKNYDDTAKKILNLVEIEDENCYNENRKKVGK